MKKLLTSILIIFGSILLLTFILTLLSYFNITRFNCIKIIIPVFSTFLGGFILGKKNKKDGWKEGLKLSLIFIIILIILEFILKNKFEFKNIIYYLILISSTTLGSMIGINIKKTDN